MVSSTCSSTTTSSDGGCDVNRPGNLLILDWDGTLATSDTLSLIAPSPEALRPYTEAYVADYRALADRSGPRDSLERMTAFLDAMQDVEYASVNRAEQGGLFRGMTRSSMLERARPEFSSPGGNEGKHCSSLTLQKGAVDLLNSFKGRWAIVSVGWSGEFIREALKTRGVQADDDLEIRANEVVFDEDGLGTGKMTKHRENERGIRTARDKLREMRDLVRQWRGRPPQPQDTHQPQSVSAISTEGRTIYVGDSETDLLCLLEADVGIIMNSPSMVEKCRSLGLQVHDRLQNVPGTTLVALPDFTPLLQSQ